MGGKKLQRDLSRMKRGQKNGFNDEREIPQMILLPVFVLFFTLVYQDYIETERLLHSDNVNQGALLSYAREAADFGTNYQLPSLDYAMNHYGQPDVAMFDFTCMYASENAALIREKNGHQLLVALVGDSLLEVQGEIH